MSRTSDSGKDQWLFAPLSLKCLRKTFLTKSTYSGTANMFGLNGEGIYKFPDTADGLEYHGTFKCGQFHGYGRLVYTSGLVIYGRWWCGRLQAMKIVFADGLTYDPENWKYLSKDDRRFAIEHKNGIRAAGRSHLSNEETTQIIPDGMYDTVDGFYSPQHKVVYDRVDLNKIIRVPLPEERSWIEEHCRNSRDDTVGPRNDLYDVWPVPASWEPCKKMSM